MRAMSTPSVLRASSGHHANVRYAIDAPRRLGITRALLMSHESGVPDIIAVEIDAYAGRASIDVSPDCRHHDTACLNGLPSSQRVCLQSDHRSRFRLTVRSQGPGTLFGTFVFSPDTNGRMGLVGPLMFTPFIEASQYLRCEVRRIYAHSAETEVFRTG